MKKLIVHLVSESSGQTVKHAANTALAKFSDIEVKKYHWPMTRNLNVLQEVFEKAFISRKNSGRLLVIHIRTNLCFTSASKIFAGQFFDNSS